MTTLVEFDGRAVRSPLQLRAEVVVVGSGPAGATAAWTLASRGLSVIVLEEGDEATTAAFPESGLEAMSRWYRELGMSVALGPTIIPYLQGKAVGGTSVINGAICWNLPRDVHEQWLRDDPALGEQLPWSDVVRAEAMVDARLQVAPTDPAVAGTKNLLLGKGAGVLGLEHRPIRRNTPGCRGSGRCLQGCPTGAKASADRTFLADAVKLGAKVVSGVRARRLVLERRRAVGVEAVTARGVRVDVSASHAVVVAASAIQTPLLLRESGLTRGPVGDNLMAHPGVSVTGRFAEPVNNHLGATQGHEVIGLRHEGIKVEALGFDVSILASRLPGTGAAFTKSLAQLHHHAAWGAAIRAKARGSVRSVGGATLVRYALTADDVKTVRRGASVVARLFVAAGAEVVAPGISGVASALHSMEQASALETSAPLDAGAYSMSMTHLFGTARMGSDPRTSVVRPDFRHHDVEGLFVADSSVFPTNTGVNPMVSIMGLAHLCGLRVAA
ncbi:MAG: GMC family oxidoreductase [Archangium sp.]|nr:GMC family oxidoreductase [Archangium sp.]